MAEENKTSFFRDFNWKRALVTTSLMIITAATVGGVLWWVMDRNANDIKASSDRAMSEMKDQVDTMADRIEKAQNKTTTTSSASACPAASTNCIETVTSFCQGLHPDAVISGISIMKTTNGIYANCGITDADGGGGGFLIAKKINNSWTNLWEGNGVISTQLCDQYKIPNKMSGGTCNY